MSSRRTKPKAAGRQRRGDFLPVSRQECAARGWNELDVIVVTPDAYVDHSSFPAALLGRLLEAEGLRVGVIDRPDPQGDDLARLGEPAMFFALSAGAVDSMVSNYTAQKRPRSDDAYAPGGKGGGRPDRCAIGYANALRRLFGREVPVLAGGVEVSLRRFAHYDFWSNKVRRPIILDAPVDAVVYGMGEAPLLEIVERMKGAGPVRPEHRAEAFAGIAREVCGVVHREPASRPPPLGYHRLPNFEEVRDDAEAHCRAFAEESRLRERGVYQESAGKRVIANPPAAPLTTVELDRLYELPFTRRAHPSHTERVPALELVQFSIASHRGCCGGCAFCGISTHQGKALQSRSRESILRELRAMTRHPDFRGTVRDIGGPTANMWGSACSRETPCNRTSCLAPRRCEHFADNQSGYVDLLDAARETKGVKNLFVSTGIRMDMALSCSDFIEDLAAHYTSGHLKVAPEHVSPRVLRQMNKPAGEFFERFLDAYADASRRAGKTQYVLPYFIAAHPGSRIEDMIEVALFLRRRNIVVEQCQIFTPLPGTASAVMYATGINPLTGEKVFVERDVRRREMQKALILSHRPESAGLVREALRIAGRRGLEAELAARRSTV